MKHKKNEVESSELTKTNDEAKDSNSSNKAEEIKEEATNTDVEIQKSKVIKDEAYQYDSEYLESIEQTRSQFLKKYRMQNILKWVVSILCLGIVVFCWVALPNILGKREDNLSLILAIVVSVVTIIIVFGYSFLIKRLLNKKMKSYFAMYYTNVTNYVFDESLFKDVFLNSDGKIEDIQFIENDLFQDVYQVGSRGVISFKYKDIEMTICDCAGQIKDQKSLKPVFVGKYLMAPCSYAEEDPIFIYLKGDQRSIPPTNLGEVKTVFDDSVMGIYSNNPKWSKTMTMKVKRALSKIKVNKYLIDVSISIKKGRVCVCLGYDDALMVLPLEHSFNPAPNAAYKRELPDVCDFVSELNK